MTRKPIIVALFVCSFVLAGCKFDRGMAGSGVGKTEKRDVKSFNAIQTTGAYEIDVICQKPASVEVEADDNILPLIKSEVRDGVLYVSSEKRYHSGKTVVLRINVPDLVAITSNGAGEIKVADAAGDNLKIDSTGAASVDAGGKIKNLTISSAGAGKIDTTRLQAQKVKVDVTGAASVDVYASDQLDVQVSGAGSVTYSGNPKTVNKNVSGIGSVRAKEQ